MKLAILCFFFIVFGTTRVLLIKLINEKDFAIPEIQTLAMFMSGTIFILLFAIKTIKNKSDNFLRYSPLLIPTALMDAVSTYLALKSITMISLSTFQLIKTITIPFIMVCSVIVFRRLPERNEVLGVLFIIAGILIAFYNTDNSSDKKEGISYILGSCCFVALQLIYEEFLIKKKQIDTMFIIGMNGIYGIIIMMIYFAVSDTFYLFNDGYNAIQKYVELKWILPIIIFLIAFDNIAGMTITKEISASYRAVIDLLRIISISVASYVVGFEGPLSLAKLLGFSVVIIGFIIYNLIPDTPKKEVIEEDDEENISSYCRI